MIAWIKHDKSARLENMPELMEHVRLPLLTRDYLVQVKEILCSAFSTFFTIFLNRHFAALCVVARIRYFTSLTKRLKPECWEGCELQQTQSGLKADDDP